MMWSWTPRPARSRLDQIEAAVLTSNLMIPGYIGMARTVIKQPDLLIKRESREATYFKSRMYKERMDDIKAERTGNDVEVCNDLELVHFRRCPFSLASGDARLVWDQCVQRSSVGIMIP